MTKKNLFVPDVKNKVSRNAFDLSHRRIFSSKAGEILPCLIQECLPGDKFKIKSSSFTRTAPLNEAAFIRLKQYYNFYFVPYRLLYRDFPAFVVQQSKSSKAAVGISDDVTVPDILPYVLEDDLHKFFVESTYLSKDKHQTIVPANFAESTHFFNCVGLNRLEQSRKLLQYCGYYKVTRSKFGFNSQDENNRISVFPLLAYQKVYNDYYRFSQWENEQANTYNVDYMSGQSSLQLPISKLFVRNEGVAVNGYHFASSKPNMFDLRYVNFTKDTFLGSVPTSQFGATSTVTGKSVSSFTLPKLSLRLNPTSQNPDGGSHHLAAFGNDAADTFFVGMDNDDRKNTFVAYNEQGSSPSTTFSSIYTIPSFDILSLRAAEAKQKFLEVTLSNNSDYKSQIEAHFNVKVSSLQSGLCDFIGGFSADLSINTVVNTNLSEDNVATYSATANASGSGNFDFEAKEHGLIIGVTYTLPFVDYSVMGYDVNALRVNFSDFALPEFDRLGYENIDPRLLTGNLIGPNFEDEINLGYGPRYYDYKTAYDIVLGDFNSLQYGTQPNFVCSLSQTNSIVDVPILNKRTLNNADNVSSGLLSDAIDYHISYSSFKVYPSILNNIFNLEVGVFSIDGDKYNVLVHDDTSFDQFYNVLNLDISVIRNLDRLGLPY